MGIWLRVVQLSDGLYVNGFKIQEKEEQKEYPLTFNDLYALYQMCMWVEDPRDTYIQ